MAAVKKSKEEREPEARMGSRVWTRDKGPSETALGRRKKDEGE